MRNRSTIERVLRRRSPARGPRYVLSNIFVVLLIAAACEWLICNLGIMDCCTVTVVDRSARGSISQAYEILTYDRCVPFVELQEIPCGVFVMWLDGRAITGEYSFGCPRGVITFWTPAGLVDYQLSFAVACKAGPMVIRRPPWRPIVAPEGFDPCIASVVQEWQRRDSSPRWYCDEHRQSTRPK